MFIINNSSSKRKRSSSVITTSVVITSSAAAATRITSSCTTAITSSFLMNGMVLSSLFRCFRLPPVLSLYLVVVVLVSSSSCTYWNDCCCTAFTVGIRNGRGRLFFRGRRGGQQQQQQPSSSSTSSSSSSSRFHTMNDVSSRSSSSISMSPKNNMITTTTTTTTMMMMSSSFEKKEDDEKSNSNDSSSTNNNNNVFSDGNSNNDINKNNDSINGNKESKNAVTTTSTTSTNANNKNSMNNNNNNSGMMVGKLEELKLREAELSSLLAAVRAEKVQTIRSRPLTIGVIGYGRFGQFISKTFRKYAGNVIVTSLTNYTDIATSMDCIYVPYNNFDLFLSYHLDVIVIATSIVSFESTIQTIAPAIQKYIHNQQQQIMNNNGSSIHGPLVVDVLSVKEHARNIMLQYLPKECDILCTHPMFGPDSGKNGWYNLNFVYEKTRIDQVVLLQSSANANQQQGTNNKRKLHAISKEENVDGTITTSNNNNNTSSDTFIDDHGFVHNVHEDSNAHIEGMDRMERFLSIWEEEGCNMVSMSCSDHDMYAANSQFITHLIGRVLNNQGLESTPIDTSGFQSVLKLIQNTCSDSFDLFYGLYKYNRKNSYETIQQLQTAMNDVVTNLQLQEQKQEQQQLQQVSAAPTTKKTIIGQPNDEEDEEKVKEQKVTSPSFK